ncbi:MAG: helix-turn-helix domain-containing protein [Candidatus Cloacimonetes bacterium]|nr:helix-turn-helix domain-containing protein [Candidatus Cloacimonadota bacterium]
MLGERLQQILRKLELNQTGLAKSLNISNVVINRYIKNKTTPDYNFLNKLAAGFNVNINWLLTGEGAPFYSEQVRNIGDKQYLELPVVAAVSCGSPAEILAAEPEDYLLVDTHSLPGDFSDYFAFSASGDSMDPFISHGDIVVVKHEEEWERADNRICVIKIDGEVTLKKITIFSEGREILLSPFNKEYSPILINEDSCQDVYLIGVAIMAVRSL